MLKQLKHIGLFSGIGGFEYAAKLMGWQTIAWAEIDPFCREVLGYHYPNAKKHKDVKATDFTVYRGKANVFTAGFPCQPSSTAGKRKGLEDERWLWPETRRAYNECQPDWIIIENVGGLLSILEPKSLSEVETKAIELFRENEDNYTSTVERLQRRAIGTIIQEIEQDGFLLPKYEDGTPIIFCIPACAVNAPHRRDRIWIVAENTNNNGCSCNITKENTDSRKFGNLGAGDYGQLRTNYEKISPFTHTNSNGQQWSNSQHEEHTSKGRIDAFCNTCESIGNGFTTNSASKGLQKRTDTGKSRLSEQVEKRVDNQPKRFSDKQTSSNTNGKRLRYKINRHGKSNVINENISKHNWQAFPTQSPVCSGNDGISDRLHGITFSKWRQETIKGYGNAIVPEIALRFYHLIDFLMNQK